MTTACFGRDEELGAFDVYLLPRHFDVYRDMLIWVALPDTGELIGRVSVAIVQLDSQKHREPRP